MNDVVSVATPSLTVPVPRDVVPWRNSTVPVAAVLEEDVEIVAVSVTLAPTATEVADGESVTVLVLVPASGSQKPAQPEIAGMPAASTARRIRLHFLLPRVFDLIVCLFRVAGEFSKQRSMNLTAKSVSN